MKLVNVVATLLAMMLMVVEMNLAMVMVVKMNFTAKMGWCHCGDGLYYISIKSMLVLVDGTFVMSQIF